jgi:hypothetical protein
MMKWFRKHNKQLLAVFASALLVVWLGGQAFEKMFQPNPQAQVVGTVAGHKATVGEFQILRSRLELLDSMGIVWQVPWRNPWVMAQLNLPERIQQDPIMMAGARPLTGNRGMTQWWLLDREARQMGVTISTEQVQQFLRQAGRTDEELTAIRDRVNVSTEDLFATVAEYLRVSYAAVLASAGVQVTDPELKDLFVRTNDQVAIRYTLLPQEAFAAEKDPAASQPVTEAELQDLFNKYKDNLPGAGKYGFGYKIADRVSVQYVGASTDDIVRTLPPVSEDRARKYFEAHREKFQPPTPPTTQPTSQPVVKFEDVKDRVIEQIRQDDAAQILRQSIEEIRATAFSEYSGSKVDLDAGKVPTSLRNILEVRRNEFSVAKKLPLVYRQTGLLTQEEAAREPGISSASAPGTQGRLGFADYAFLVEKPGQKADVRSEEPVTRLKLYQPTTVRDEAGGNLRGMYVFRVVSQEAAHAPATLIEVKDQVQRDARTLQAYHKAEAAAQKLLASARDESLQAAFARQFPSLATRPATTRPSATPGSTQVEMFEQDAVTRARAIPGYFVYFNDSLTFPTRLLGIQNAEAVLKACFDIADAGPASQPAGKRITLVDLPDQKAFVVVEVLSHKPANEPEFAKAKITLMAEMRIQKLRNFYAGWYNPDMIEKRMQWQSKGVFE